MRTDDSWIPAILAQLLWHPRTKGFSPIGFVPWIGQRTARGRRVGFSIHGTWSEFLSVMHLELNRVAGLELDPFFGREGFWHQPKTQLGWRGVAELLGEDFGRVFPQRNIGGVPFAFDHFVLG